MHRIFFALLILVLMFIPGFGVAAQSGDSTGAGIGAPTPGSPLKGLVTIEGTTALDGFLSWEITFNYVSDTTGSWFLIAEGDQAITQGELTQWDTNTITDGDYNLRLTVFLEGGRREHFVVNNLRVRNYSPIETVTPTPTLTSTPYTETPRPSLTATITQPPSETPVPDTPTPLPTNPVIITQNDITNSLTRGAAGAAVAFVLVGLYLSIKRIFRR
jgi:hypothetical protein